MDMITEKGLKRGVEGFFCKTKEASWIISLLISIVKKVGSLLFFWLLFSRLFFFFLFLFFCCCFLYFFFYTLFLILLFCHFRFVFYYLKKIFHKNIISYHILVWLTNKQTCTQWFVLKSRLKYLSFPNLILLLLPFHIQLY